MGRGRGSEQLRSDPRPLRSIGRRRSASIGAIALAEAVGDGIPDPHGAVVRHEEIHDATAALIEGAVIGLTVWISSSRSPATVEALIRIERAVPQTDVAVFKPIALGTALGREPRRAGVSGPLMVLITGEEDWRDGGERDAEESHRNPELLRLDGEATHHGSSFINCRSGNLSEKGIRYPIPFPQRVSRTSRSPRPGGNGGPKSRSARDADFPVACGEPDSSIHPSQVASSLSSLLKSIIRFPGFQEQFPSKQPGEFPGVFTELRN
jgi:hypothetical protein